MKPTEQTLPGSDCKRLRTIIDRVGDKWSVYVVMTLKGGAMRFNEIRRSIEGVSQRMLTLTLRDLERDGLITRTVYPTKPPSVEYALTIVGTTLVAPAMTLIAWAETNYATVEQSRRQYDEKAAR